MERCTIFHCSKPTGAPVMVFFHGGGFDTGYGYMFNGVPLAALGDVIVITLNYRLGPFGFLTAGTYHTF